MFLLLSPSVMRLLRQRSNLVFWSSDVSTVHNMCLLVLHLNLRICSATGQCTFNINGIKQRLHEGAPLFGWKFIANSIDALHFQTVGAVETAG